MGETLEATCSLYLPDFCSLLACSNCQCNICQLDVESFSVGSYIRRELFNMLANQCSCSRAAAKEAQAVAADEFMNGDDDTDGHCCEAEFRSSVQGPQQEVSECLEEPSVHLAMVTALARLHTGILAPSQVRDLLAGAPHSAQAPEQITLQGFQMAAAKIYEQDIKNIQRLADVLAPVMAGKVDLDAAGKLPILYAEHIRKQPLHATVPLITAEEVLSLQQQPHISDLIAIDCRMAEEYDVRPLLHAVMLHSAAMVPTAHNSVPFPLISSNR
jgi:hypothetical protein